MDSLYIDSYLFEHIHLMDFRWTIDYHRIKQVYALPALLPVRSEPLNGVRSQLIPPSVLVHTPIKHQQHNEQIKQLIKSSLSRVCWQAKLPFAAEVSNESDDDDGDASPACTIIERIEVAMIATATIIIRDDDTAITIVLFALDLFIITSTHIGGWYNENRSDENKKEDRKQTNENGAEKIGDYISDLIEDAIKAMAIGEDAFRPKIIIALCPIPTRSSEGG
jgi:hypothetical protein